MMMMMTFGQLLLTQRE